MATTPERYALHFEDETHLETNPCLPRLWHRIGRQATVPAAGTARRLTVFGSVEAVGRGRIEVLGGRQDSTAIARYLAALDARHEATGRRAGQWPVPLCSRRHSIYATTRYHIHTHSLKEGSPNESTERSHENRWPHLAQSLPYWRVVYDKGPSGAGADPGGKRK